MKNWMMYLCAGVLMLGLTACGGEKTGQQDTVGTENSVQEDNSAATEENAQEQDSQVQQESSEVPDVDLEAVKAAIVETVGVENYFPDMTLDAEMLEGMTGISADMYDDFLAEMPMISTNVDTLIIVRAKDGQLEAVQEALNTYREAKVSDTMQYPMNVGKIQASRIETFGNYVCFVQLGGDVMAALEEGEEAVIEHCLQMNELVLEVIGQQMN